MVEYFINHNKDGWHVYSQVMTDFGGGAVNWVCSCETREEAEDVIKSLEGRL